MKAKLKDVAALAGVAPNTASTILNRRSNSWASKETEQRVFDAAKTLGYKPSRAALALRLGRYRTIGLVIPDLHNPFYTTLADLLEERFRAAGYDMIMEHARADIERERHCFTSILERQVDGVVYVVSDVQAHLDFFAKASGGSRPVVALTSQRVKTLGVDTVLLDFTPGFAEAIDTLYRLGHRDYVFLSALAKGQDHSERPRLFEQLLRERGIPAGQMDIVRCDHNWESARTAFKAFLQERGNLQGHGNSRRPTALIAINDLSAIAAMRAACELGLRVPEDLSVVGVDNIRLGAYLPRQLSTIEQPLTQMAAASAELLLERLENKGDAIAEPQLREFATTFVPKETTAAAAVAARA